MFHHLPLKCILIHVNKNNGFQHFFLKKPTCVDFLTMLVAAYLMGICWQGSLLTVPETNFERQGMTYELLLEIFSMEKLNSLLYRNCSVNFFIE